TTSCGSHWLLHRLASDGGDSRRLASPTAAARSTAPRRPPARTGSFIGSPRAGGVHPHPPPPPPRPPAPAHPRLPRPPPPPPPHGGLRLALPLTFYPRGGITSSLFCHVSRRFSPRAYPRKPAHGVRLLQESRRTLAWI